MAKATQRASTARGEATRERIVVAARKLLLRGGPAGTSLRAIAAEAGITLSNLQFHFADTEVILRALLDTELAKAARSVEAAIAERPEDPVGAAIDALLDLQQERGSARLFFSMWAVATTSPKLRAALHAFYGSWIERVGGFRGADDARAFLFVSLLEGASLFRSGVAGTSDQGRERALRQTLRTLVVGDVVTAFP